jgi:hypothetical protein
MNTDVLMVKFLLLAISATSLLRSYRAAAGSTDSQAV